MPVIFLLVGVWDVRGAVTVEGAGEVVLSQPSSGQGVGVDGVFGARVVFAPAIDRQYRFLATSLGLRVGTLGAKATDGTAGVNVRATDIRSDLLVHLRWVFETKALRIIPAALVGLDVSIAPEHVTAPGLSVSRVAFTLGFGYGVRAALEGRHWSVAVNVLLVSQDARMPTLFMGLSAGYVVRL